MKITVFRDVTMCSSV